VTGLLEREAEMRRLHQLLADARAGRGRVVFVSGEAGIGKTALITALVEEAAGVRVAIGRCDALATPRPLGAFTDVTSTLAVPRSERDSLLASLLLALRQDPPTVLVIEDAQWADEATIELIGMLGRRVADVAVLMIVTYRDDQVAAEHPLRLVIGDLVTANATAWIGLGPLSLDAVRALAAGHHTSAVELHERTGGNPFYVTEALAAPDEPVPATVRMAVLARAARLDPSAREVLEAVAIVPGRAEGWLVEALCGAPADALDACVAAGMLLRDSNAVAFRHELGRLAVAAEVPERRRRELNAQAVLALSARPGADPARIAHHAAECGDEGAIATWSRLACADAVARTAHREAVRHGERALRGVVHLRADDIAELRTNLARAMVALSRGDDAELLARQAAEHWRVVGDDAREAAALIAVSAALGEMGRMEASLTPLRRAIELLERHQPGADLAEAYVRMASTHMLARERDEAVVWGQRAIDLATALGDAMLLGRAVIQHGTADLMVGRPEGLAHIRQGIEIGERHQLPAVVAIGHLQIGSGCGEMRRYDVAVPALEAGIAISAEHHLESFRRYQSAWLARCRFDLGQWDDAAALARESVAGRTSLIARFVALNTMGWLRARRGDDDVWPLLDESLDIARHIAHLQRLWPVAVARAEAGWLAGALQPHVPLLREVLALAQRRRHALAVGEIGLWLWRAGAIDAAPPDAAEPFAGWMSGDHLGAAAAFRRMGNAYEAASALADTNDTASMRAAWATFDRLGAEPHARLVATALDERGVRISRSERVRAKGPTNVAGLTGREVEVLRLVAAGFSNPQIGAALFISRKTAEHHVSNILIKLGASGRAEAAAAAVRSGVLEDS
jgi:DNA-binding CsgD family transcriptional regulator/tetratricopeptide (TPR) repeat protein